VSNSGKYYPSVYLDGVDGLPESGLITFRFETRRKTTTELPKEGETSHECCIDLTSIESVKGDKKAKADDESTGDALERLRKEVEDEKDEKDY